MKPNMTLCVMCAGALLSLMLQPLDRVVRPDGSRHSFLTFGDTFTTNIAFGGADGRDAYITLSGSGRLVKVRWHCAGHRCHYEDLLDPARVIGGGSPKL